MANYEYVRPNRRFDTIQKDTDVTCIKWYFCFGDSASVNSCLKNRNGWVWVLPKFLNALLRGFSQTVFANNPFSGLIVLTGLMWFNLTTGLLVLANATNAVLTAVVVNLHPKSIISGHVLFNGILFASVTSSLWTPIYKEPLPLNVYIFILAGSPLSVLISSGLTNILSSAKPNIPLLAIPFHVLVFVTFACWRPDKIQVQQDAGILNGNLTTNRAFIREDILYNHTLIVPDGDEFFATMNGTENAAEFYSWGNVQNVFLGITLSSGQVFGVGNFVFSLLVYAAVLIYSPVLTFMCFYGATIGTVLGLFLTQFPNEEVFLGVWGYNGFLSGAAIGLFYIFNLYSFLIGTASLTFTAVLQFCLTPSFSAHNIPVFGLPFILSTVLFVCATSNGDQLVRVKTVTFPEHQRCSYYETKKRKNEEELLAARI